MTVAVALVVAACILEVLTGWGLIAHGARLLTVKSPTRLLWFWTFVAGAMSLPAVLIVCAGWLAPALVDRGATAGPCPRCRYHLPMDAARCPECGLDHVTDRRRRMALRAARTLLRVTAGAVVAALAIAVVILAGKALSEGRNGLPMIYLMLLLVAAWALNGTIAWHAATGAFARNARLGERVVYVFVTALALYVGIAASLNALFVVRGPVGTPSSWPSWLTTEPGMATARWVWLWSLGAAMVVVTYGSRTLAPLPRWTLRTMAALIGALAALTFVDLALRVVSSTALLGSLRFVPEIARFVSERMPDLFPVIHPRRVGISIAMAVGLVVVVVLAWRSARSSLQVAATGDDGDGNGDDSTRSPA
ncbi:MAG: hypothetical protein JNM94_06605 [Phycisphaerae bacterium]|nr:hypothetical protein [Phycisphaerae bacterium]